MEVLITLLIFIVVGVIVLYLINWGLGVIPGLPSTIRSVITVALAIIFVLWILLKLLNIMGTAGI